MGEASGYGVLRRRGDSSRRVLEGRRDPLSDGRPSDRPRGGRSGRHGAFGGDGR
jgi:hypothetical protein